MRAVLAGIGLEQLGREVALAHGDHLGAQVVGDDLQDGVQVQDPEVLQDLADGLAGALELAQHLLVLQVVDQALLLDQRQQRDWKCLRPYRACDYSLAFAATAFGLRRPTACGQLQLLELGLDRDRVLRLGDHFLAGDHARPGTSPSGSCPA